MTDIDPRKRYWDETYLAYWRARVEEAAEKGASGVVKGDAKTEDDDVIREVLRRTPPEPGTVLDVGCAWGRMFPLYHELGLVASGADISSAMIAAAKEEWAGKASVARLVESEAEQLPFATGEFDNVVCLATFDATYQHRALAELLRVLRPRGLLYLSGKNTRYAEDDDLALKAEIGARRKGHPNYFTDVAAMLAQAVDAGHKVERAYYFARRGDFAQFEFAATAPERFYEYLVVIRRGANPSAFQPFADKYSVTFRKQDVAP